MCPLKFGKKYFSGNYYIKFGHFSGKNHVKFENFVNFSEKYYKNSGILLIFIHIFRAKMWCPPKVDPGPTPMIVYPPFDFLVK